MYLLQLEVPNNGEPIPQKPTSCYEYYFFSNISDIKEFLNNEFRMLSFAIFKCVNISL